MTSPSTIFIDAAVSVSEHAMMTAAADGLHDALHAADGGDAYAVELRFVDDRAAVDGRKPGTVYVASLLDDAVAAGTSLEEVEQRWRRNIEQLDGSYESRFLCTVFRYVHAATAGREALTQRIHRLNRMAAELSHDTGIAVIDLDRDLAHIGALALDADYRLTSPAALRVAAHVIVIAMLAVGLDSTVAQSVRTQASRWHGKLSPEGEVVRMPAANAPRQGAPVRPGA